MIAARCSYCTAESSAPANAHAVVTITTSAGTVRRVESVCPDCGRGVSTYLDEWEAHAISALLVSRRAIDELRRLHLLARRN